MSQLTETDLLNAYTAAGLCNQNSLEECRQHLCSIINLYVCSRFKWWVFDAGLGTSLLHPCIPRGSDLANWVSLYGMLRSETIDAREVVSMLQHYDAFKTWIHTPLNWADQVRLVDMAKQFMYPNATKLALVWHNHGSEYKSTCPYKIHKQYLRAVQDYFGLFTNSNETANRWEATKQALIVADLQYKMQTTPKPSTSFTA